MAAVTEPNFPTVTGGGNTKQVTAYDVNEAGTCAPHSTYLLA